MSSNREPKLGKNFNGQVKNTLPDKMLHKETCIACKLKKSKRLLLSCAICKSFKERYSIYTLIFFEKTLGTYQFLQWAKVRGSD